MALKAAWRALVPTGVRLAVRRLIGDVTTYTGPYDSWAGALVRGRGYQDAAVLAKVRDATRKVVLGKAAYEQDSVIFAHASRPERIARVLGLAAGACGRPLHVLDFGGSLGSHYYRMRPFLGDIDLGSWLVCEQTHFVRAGREFETDVLRFSSDPASLGRPDVLLLSSVLPYLEHPIEQLLALIELRPDWILIDRMPLSPDGLPRLFNQQVPRSIYRASYPVWLLPEAELASALEDYVLVERGELDEQLRSGSLSAAYHWMIWRRVSHG